MTDYTSLRSAMVDCQIRPSDVTRFPIIEAMLTVPREKFVPSDLREVAYAGEHIFLGGNRVVMDPRVLAKTLDMLDIGRNELVLELGAGLGYSAAVIAHMAEAVIAVEEDEALATEAEANLTTGSIDNACIVTGALREGASKHGPYDVITFGGAVQEVPTAILDQLKEGGRIAAVFADGAAGQCRIGVKTGGIVAWRNAFDATAPILPGFEQTREFAL